MVGTPYSYFKALVICYRPFQGATSLCGYLLLLVLIVNVGAFVYLFCKLLVFLVGVAE